MLRRRSAGGIRGGAIGATGRPPAAATQVPQPADNSVNWPGAGYGAGALLCNVLYIPAKLTYAILGGVVGGGTYLVTAGNQQAANTVWRSALGGDYVVTPQMLAGQQPINFSGPTDTPPDEPAAATSSLVEHDDDYDCELGRSRADNAAAARRASSATGSGQPLDHGAGPASGSAAGANIE